MLIQITTHQWNGRNKEVRKSDNQCIEHSISKNIIEKVDIVDVDTNDYEVDLTAAGAYKRLKVRSFSNPYLVTLRELWLRFKRTPSPWKISNLE